jgi:hypothetical protein
LREIRGYRVQATDGDIGFVDDFIMEDETCALRYLVVSTHKWVPGRKVLISPQWLVRPISCEMKTVTLFMTRESVERSPEFNPEAQVNRGYESKLYEHYGRAKYWTPKGKEPKAKRGSETKPHTVHFEVTNPTAHKVCLAGNFNDWRPEKTEMMPLGGGKWEKDLMLAPGTYEYRLVVDGKWMDDPNARHSVTNAFGERNSVLTVN